MRARVAVLAVLLTGVAVLAGCTQETRDTVRGAVEEAQTGGLPTDALATRSEARVTEPVDATEPAEPAPTQAEPAPPVAATEPAEPAQPAAPAEPAPPVAATEPADTAAPAEPVAPVVEATEPAEPATPAESAAPVDAESVTPAPTELAEEGAEGAEGADGAETTSALVLGAILLLVGVLIALLARRRPAPAREADVAPAVSGPADWQSRGRAVYAEVRWLQDRLDEPTAAWRGLELAGGQAMDPDDPRARDWWAIERRLPTTLDELYDLEAHAPSPEARLAVEQVTRALQDLHGAVDALALHLRDHPHERTREQVAGAPGAPEQVIDLGPPEADAVRDARARLTRALGDLQAHLLEEDPAAS
jgi:outer membrane biosynthesis protein TonB